jgi:anaerobic selenocysteine-containing dehydrogenase
MKTFCRLCEVSCGLEADVDEHGRLAKLAPDGDHPVTAGFACHKGLLAREIHHDPDRVNHPERRRGGVFARASGDEAISDAQRAHESTLHAWRAAS